MIVLLRFIYGLPYNECFEDKPGALQPYAKVYVVAEKYQINGLKLVISKDMERITSTKAFHTATTAMNRLGGNATGSSSFNISPWSGCDSGSQADHIV